MSGSGTPVIVNRRFTKIITTIKRSMAKVRIKSHIYMRPVCDYKAYHSYQGKRCGIYRRLNFVNLSNKLNNFSRCDIIPSGVVRGVPSRVA